MKADLDRLHQLVGPVSRETESKLLRYGEMLERWTKASNLIAPSTIADLWNRHILDSAQLVALKPDARRWLDLGSGGGLPGLVVAVLLAEKENIRVDLVESNAKKAAFLNTVAAELELPASIHRARIEDVHSAVATPEIVTARALTALTDLLALSRPWLADGAVGLFHKGRDFVGELVKSRDVWDFQLIEHRSAVDPESRILEIGGLQPR
ncbi:MAG: 16S rRNA (guanine(527)-N(7))-methyltransferase RsmG [Rhizobiaceae bacterium]